MVSSSTGSGKTASFVLPALTGVLAARNDAAQRQNPDDAPAARPARRQARGPRVLVLVPTRELAIQVSRAAMSYGRHVRGLRVATVVGGVPYAAQLRQLSGAPDMLIATPGRLMDHMQSGKAILSHVEMLVLDEADRMLDMGFIDDIQFIAQTLPRERQTVMYSATFGGHVGRLAQTLLREPQRLDVASHTDIHADIEQRLHWADDLQHKNALLDHLLTDRNVDQALVFTSTQREADRLAERLFEMGHRVASLHGGMPQRRRNRVLHGLRTRDLRVLVATDVAARGIDVPTISHVINYGMPMKAEDYVHRIGRTGRAGATGIAVSLVAQDETGLLKDIEKVLRKPIPQLPLPHFKRAQPQPQRQQAAPAERHSQPRQQHSQPNQRHAHGKPQHGQAKPQHGQAKAQHGHAKPQHAHAKKKNRRRRWNPSHGQQRSGAGQGRPHRGHN
jgi:superfamily II DNA/RNA helicase